MTLTIAALLTLTPSSQVLAQGTASPAAPATTAPPQAAAPYVAVISGNAVNLRTGPSAQSAYVFGKLRTGDTVQVLAEEFGWAKVRTAGPAFGGLYAYVPADRRVTLGTDGTAQVTARTDLRAPNIDAGGSPDKSWKQIGHVEPGNTLTVLGTVEGEKETVYKVSLPGSGEGWINVQFLRRANESETAMHAAAMAVPTAPAAPPSKGTATATPANAAPVGAVASATVQRDQGAQVNDPARSSPAIPPLLGERSPALAAAPAGASAAGSTPPVPAGVRTDSHGEGSIEIEASAPRARIAVESRRATWSDLESQFEAVRQQPQASAELDALRGRYMDLARTAAPGSSLGHMASTRAEQLTLLQEAQQGAQELAAIKSKLSSRSETMMKIVVDCQQRADYSAVGILNASVVYDGKRLPQLYRVTDPQTSQTIAYVLPNESIAMGTMLGTLVGVKGGKEFDSALNINVISPQVVELLIVRDTPQVTKTEMKTDQAKPATALAEKVAAPTQSPKPDGDADKDCEEVVPPGFAPDVPPTTTR